MKKQRVAKGARSVTSENTGTNKKKKLREQARTTTNKENKGDPVTQPSILANRGIGAGGRSRGKG